MKHNPKVVSIDRSAAYVHHRAMKNRRDNNPVDALELLSQMPEYAGKFRLIPYSAVGVAGMLPVFTPELLTIDGKEEKELLVAVSPTAVGDGFEAVI